MAADLALRGLSAGTCEAYLRYAQRFVAYHKRSPHELGVEHVRTWVLHLLQVKGHNPNTVNVCIAALRYGLLAPCHATTTLEGARVLLTPKPTITTTTTTTTPKPPAVGSGDAVPSVEGAPPTWVERLLAWTGIDADRCARCGAGRLVRPPLDGRPTPSPWDTS